MKALEDINIKLVKSSFVQAVKRSDNFIIWHSLFGYPQIVSPSAYYLLNLFNKPKSIKSIFEAYTIENPDNIFKIFIKNYFLIKIGFDERRFLERKMKRREENFINSSLIDYLELRVSEECNFACKYCMQSYVRDEYKRKNTPTFMRFITAKKAIDTYMKILKSNNKRMAEISFGGGEPLLNWEVIHKTLKYCRSNYESKIHFKYSLNTNGSLINENKIKVIKEYDIEVAPSIDGLEKTNDKVRVTKKGNGTFKRISFVFNLLSVNKRIPKGVSITLDSNNFYDFGKEFIDWIKIRKIKTINVNIDVVKAINIPIDIVVERLIKLRKYALSIGIEMSGFWARPAENLNDSTISDHVSFCGAMRGNNLCVDPVGNIHNCGYSKNILGNIHNFKNFFDKDNNYFQTTAGYLVGRNEICKKCIIEGQCNGGCIITQELAKTERDYFGFNRMCDLYRLATKKLLIENI